MALTRAARSCTNYAWKHAANDPLTGSPNGRRTGSHHALHPGAIDSTHRALLSSRRDGGQATKPRSGGSNGPEDFQGVRVAVALVAPAETDHADIAGRDRVGRRRGSLLQRLIDIERARQFGVR